MQLKHLRKTQDGLTWPKENVDLPVISYQSCELSFGLGLSAGTDITVRHSPGAVEDSPFGHHIWLHSRCRGFP